VTGLLVGVSGEDYSDHRKCDRASFLEDPSVHTPRNIRVDGNNGTTNGASNGFRHNLTGALGINAARWFSLQNNVFDDNYHFPQGGNSHGGTFFFDQCTDTVRIYGNALTGPTVPYPNTEGMELWGRDIDVGGGSGATKNTIEKYGSAGITLNSASTPKIRTNEMTNIPSGPFAAGIVLYSREAEYPCMPSFRTTHNVTISGNTSPAQIDGVVLPDKEYSTNVINTVTIDSSGTVLLDPFVTLSGNVSITPSPAPQQPLANQLLPRAFAVQPFWDAEASNPGPVPGKCLATAGNSRQAFTFPVGDVSGADNIAAVEGTFTATVVDSSNPALGPVNTAEACHFRFTPPADLAACGLGGCGTLDLAESVPDYMWGPSSIVGTGGVTLENSVCRVYAGSDKSKVTNTGKVLTLTLDIEFRNSLLNSPKKYMYAITGNKNDGQSNGGYWRYWGWW
jgi:Right handed beta helix region